MLERIYEGVELVVESLAKQVAFFCQIKHVMLQAAELSRALSLRCVSIRNKVFIFERMCTNDFVDS